MTVARPPEPQHHRYAHSLPELAATGSELLPPPTPSSSSKVSSTARVLEASLLALLHTSYPLRISAPAKTSDKNSSPQFTLCKH